MSCCDEDCWCNDPTIDWYDEPDWNDIPVTPEEDEAWKLKTDSP